MTRGPRRTLALAAVLLLGIPVVASPPGADAGCSGSVKASVEDFAPLHTSGQSDVFTNTAFTCYLIQPNPSFGFHGHIRASLVNVDTGDVAVADADCPLANPGATPVPTPAGCSYSSFSPPMPRGRFQLFVEAGGAGAVPVPVGSWQAQVVMDP